MTNGGGPSLEFGDRAERRLIRGSPITNRCSRRRTRNQQLCRRSQTLHNNSLC